MATGVKCDQCKGSGRSGLSGRWRHCDACLGHGFIFDSVPTREDFANLRNDAGLLAFEDRNGELDMTLVDHVIGKWKKYYKENPNPPVPKPPAAFSYALPTEDEIMHANGVSREIARGILQRELEKQAAARQAPVDRGATTITLQPGGEASVKRNEATGPTPGSDGNTGN